MEILKTNFKWNGSLSKRSRTDYIALHHAEATNCSVQDIDRWHKNNGWTGIGYHFFVRKDGRVYEGRPLDTIGAHVSNMNNCSIGICAEGNYMTEIMPDVQKRAICSLLVYLKGIYPNAKIKGHREIGDSDCPGNNFPLADIKTGYRGYADIVEYTNVNDIIWELAHRKIITDKNLWRQYCENDVNIYWFCRKLCQYIRTKGIKERETKMYTDIHDIAWDLHYRGIISDLTLWEAKMRQDKNVFYLLQKALHYIRTH